jgi:hypothetical protein
VSLAIMRSLAVAQARVGTSYVTLVRGWEPLDVQLAALPPEACAFLRSHEAGDPVRPFTFELSVDAAPHPADELTPDLRAAVARIERRAAALLARASEFSPGSKDLYLVEQVRGRYLPDALGEYEALPGELRSGPISADGRSGTQVLRHELQLMEERLIGIARELDQPAGGEP